MSRVIIWLQEYEHRMFFAVNSKLNQPFLDFFFSKLTHLGGATATIVFTLCVALIAPGPWNSVGLQSLIALAISHVPVAFIKKKYPRMRPYLILPQTIICKNPLTDHSFPSGHTTAIFSLITPFIIVFPWLGLFGIPLAVMIALSRIYLGLHYPSDCVVGCLIGCVTAILTVTFMS